MIVRPKGIMSPPALVNFVDMGFVVTALAHDISTSALCMSMQCNYAKGIENLNKGRGHPSSNNGRENMGPIEVFHQLHGLVSLRCTILMSLFWHSTIHGTKIST